ncbi:MAG: transketolase family protein [Spirochaetales bacterium]|nr:transketolase family protein [Spirochaetales bacterium]
MHSKIEIPAIAPRQAFGEVLLELGENRQDLIVLDGDVCTSTRTDMFRDRYPERFIQAGIAEANMAGMAAGLASCGFKPVVSTFAVFLAKRALDQIRVSIAHAELPVILNGAYAGLPTGNSGATHSSVSDMAVMRSMPHMTVLDPADAEDTKAAVRLAMNHDGPVYIRTVRCPVPQIFSEGHTMEFGRSERLLEGDDVAIISSGMMTPKALEAGLALKKQGIGARVIHMGSVKPIDREAVLAAARECGAIVTVENHSVIGGLGGAVSEVVTSQSPCPVRRLGFDDRFLESGNDEILFSRYGMNTENIIEAAKEMYREYSSSK